MILSRLKFHIEINVNTFFSGGSIPFWLIVPEPSNENSSLKKLRKAGVL